MKRHVGGLISFSLLTLITGGCQPDAPIGVPVLAARVEPKPPNVLRDAIGRCRDHAAEWLRQAAARGR